MEQSSIPAQTTSIEVPVRILHSADEAAVLLGVSPRFVWKLIRSGRLPVIRLGSRTLIARATLEGFGRQESNGPKRGGPVR